MDISKLLVNNTEVITNKNNENVDQHRSNVVVNNKKRHACTWLGCRKSFSRPSDMTRHYRIHTNDRPYQCSLSLCGKRFIQRSALTVHERTHSGEKPHICQFPSCNKSFGDSSSLARHRRIHTQARSYICNSANCTKSYTKKSHLTRHIRRCHLSDDSNCINNNTNNPLLHPVTSNTSEGKIDQDSKNYVHATESKCNSTSVSYYNHSSYTSSSSRRSTIDTKSFTTTDDEDDDEDEELLGTYHSNVISTTHPHPASATTGRSEQHGYWSNPHFLCYDNNNNHLSSALPPTLYQSTHHRADYPYI